jgi:hypothetical protein
MNLKRQKLMTELFIIVMVFVDSKESLLILLYII